jgi:hypothetical protein
MIIQEYLYNHPDIVALTNVDGRQCVRFTTFVDARGNPHILNAYLKLIAGCDVFDTFNYDTSGNVMIEMDVDTGILRSVIMVEAHTHRLYTVDQHPDIQKTLRGMRLPNWQAACSLVHRAAKAFLPVRAVGWDVIIGPDAPCVVEGNIWWDPTPNLLGRMRSIADRMYAGMKE